MKCQDHCEILFIKSNLSVCVCVCACLSCCLWPVFSQYAWNLACGILIPYR